ncbi:MAG: PRC-barrel domain-containing protein, partial [Solirubrobacteraceae bacterium]
RAQRERTFRMVEVRRVEEWVGLNVLDPGGAHLGTLQEVFYDAASDDPVLIAVSNGFLGRKTRLIPMPGATASRDHIHVSYDKEQIERSEDTFGGKIVGQDQLERVAVAYGLDLSGSGQLRSASEWAKVRQDAQRRVDELAREAEKKLAHSKAVRDRADAAALDADAAEQEAERARQAVQEAREASEQYKPGGSPNE